MAPAARRQQQRVLLVAAAVALLTSSHLAQVAVAQNVLLPGMAGLGQWAANIGQQSPLLAAMPNWGGLSLGQGISGFVNPFQFGSGLGAGLFQARDGTTDPQYGRPFDQTKNPQPAGQQRLVPGINNRNSADHQQKLRELQAALRGDPAIALVVGPALLLSSSIVLTVSPSLATASTSVGIAGALIGNLVAWSKWLNNAEIFFLGLRTGAGRRSLMEAAGNDTEADGDSDDVVAYRSQLLGQLRAANDMMTAWGEQLQRVRGNLQDSNFLDFLRSQAAALQTARKALGAVQSHPLGHALDLGTPPLGLFRGLNSDGGDNDANGDAKGPDGDADSAGDGAAAATAGGLLGGGASGGGLAGAVRERANAAAAGVADQIANAVKNALDG